MTNAALASRYPHVAEAVKSGRVLLERTEGSDPNIPLLKDEFAVERRKAKVREYRRCSRPQVPCRDFFLRLHIGVELFHRVREDGPWARQGLESFHDRGAGDTRPLVRGSPGGAAVASGRHPPRPSMRVHSDADGAI